MRYFNCLMIFCIRSPNFTMLSAFLTSNFSKRIANKRCSRYHQPLPVSAAQSSGTAGNDNESDSSSNHNSKTLEASAGYFSSEMQVKKSRFIGYAKHARTWDEAQAFIQEIKVQHHPKARHVCFGFRGGANPVTERCSDDGEPTGTAGVPILGAIRGENLSDTVCVVVRYFGGIKLGAGGLIRAYGGAARLVIRDAPVQVLVPTTSTRLSVSAAYIGVVYDMISKVGGGRQQAAAIIGDEEYGADGTLTLTVTYEASERERFHNGLRDATRGEVQIHE